MMARQTIGTTGTAHRSALRVLLGLLALLLLPSDAHASLLSPEAEDKLATILALFVIFVVPVGLIVLFWMVHILPEKIAHKRHHPQFEAIRTLCLLSLVFGGLLWPFAWLWAYSKPVMYKMAYGTDKHPDSEEFKKEAWPDEKHEPAGTLGLSDRMARLEQRGLVSADLKTLRADLDALEARLDAKETR
jgi:CBS domain containing-hemolysin-like protein